MFQSSTLLLFNGHNQYCIFIIQFMMVVPWKQQMWFAGIPVGVLPT